MCISDVGSGAFDSYFCVRMGAGAGAVRKSPSAVR